MLNIVVLVEYIIPCTSVWNHTVAEPPVLAVDNLTPNTPLVLVTAWLIEPVVLATT
jgi:hypothetical protein